jgi:hypothetical protein
MLASTEDMQTLPKQQTACLNGETDFAQSK